MTNDLESIQEQIRQLELQKEALIKLQSEGVLITSGLSAGTNLPFLKLSHGFNQEANEIMKPFRYIAYNMSREVPPKLFEGILASLSSITNVTLDESCQETKAQIIIRLNIPEIVIDYKEPNLVVKFSSSCTLNRYSFFSYEIESVVREDYIRRNFTLPLSNGVDLMDCVDKHKVDHKIELTESAKLAIEGEIRRNSIIDSIALLDDYPEGDVKFAGDDHLRPFQRVTMKFAELANERFLIGDEMGLGKMWQQIAMTIRGQYRGLFIVPPGLIPNWQRTVKRLSGKDALVFRGREPNQVDIMELVVHKAHQFNLIGWSALSTVFETEAKAGKDSISVSPWVNYINLSQFEIIHLDEVHNGKNENSGRSKAMLQLKSPRIVGASGTPVINRPGEYFNFLHLIAPQTFHSRTDFISRFTDGKNGARNVGELRKLLRPIMIRRKQADVNKDLPPIQRIQDEIELTQEQIKEYNKLLDGIVEYIMANGEKISQEINMILVKITYLKQFMANICADRSAELAIECYENAVENEHKHKKVIIFSQFRATCEKIANLLGHEALWFDGTVNVDKRMETVDEFIANPKYKYLCVTTKSASEGLSITIAGSVIFNDLMWTPADHSQAEARAYGRLNDAHGVNSYYVMIKDTIMSWIWELLEAKLRVIEETVDGVQSSRTGESIAMTIIQRLKGL